MLIVCFGILTLPMIFFLTEMPSFVHFHSISNPQTR
jgi:hypothetical protein